MSAGTEVPQPQSAASTKPSGRAAVLMSAWLRDLTIALAIVAFVIVFLYEPVRVEGTSMMPGLQDQERIFISKFIYSIEPIHRGDIVVFRYPRDPQQSFIKRVIGVAGDHVRIVDGHVILNGKLLVEDYVPAEYQDELSYAEIVVPPDSYFVLGDHRSLSRDSRNFGPVESSYIYGKAVFGYWPVDKMGRLH